MRESRRKALELLPFRVKLEFRVRAKPYPPAFVEGYARGKVGPALTWGSLMAGWYIQRGEKIVGPVDLQKLRELVGNGRVLPTDNLSTDITGPWNEAGRTDLFADNVKIKKGILGGHAISYDCPHCSAAIKSPLDDAGKSDTCPQCNRQIIVPGAGQRDRIREGEIAAAEIKRDATELQQRKKQEITVQRQRPELNLQPKVQFSEIQHPPQIPPVSSETRSCPYCAEQILVAAKKCKHCGEFLAGERTKTRTTAKTITLRASKRNRYLSAKGAAVVVAVFIAIIFLRSLSDAPQASDQKLPPSNVSVSPETQLASQNVPPNSSDKHLAASEISSGSPSSDDEGHKLNTTFVERLISKSLVAPSTAKFAPFLQWNIEQFGPHALKYESYVDAENQFGAHIRVNFAVVVYRKAGTTKITYLQVDDEKVGTLDAPGEEMPKDIFDGSPSSDN